jgi:hypothetical protein
MSPWSSRCLQHQGTAQHARFKHDPALRCCEHFGLATQVSGPAPHSPHVHGVALACLLGPPATRAAAKMGATASQQVSASAQGPRTPCSPRVKQGGCPFPHPSVSPLAEVEQDVKCSRALHLGVDVVPRLSGSGRRCRQAGSVRATLCSASIAEVQLAQPVADSGQGLHTHMPYMPQHLSQRTSRMQARVASNSAARERSRA